MTTSLQGNFEKIPGGTTPSKHQTTFDPEKDAQRRVDISDNCVPVDTPSAKTAQETLYHHMNLWARCQLNKHNHCQSRISPTNPENSQNIDQADDKNRAEAFSKPGCPLSSCNNVKVQLGARRLALMFASCLPLSPKVSHGSASHPSFNERWHQGERIN